MLVEKIFTCKYQTMTHNHIGEVLKQIGDLLQSKGYSQYMKRKIYSVASECIENIYNHGFFDPKNPLIFSEFTIYTEDSSIFIYSKNCVKSNEVDKIQFMVDTLNAMRSSDLKLYFQSTIKERSLYSIGGAGVGLIMMRRKSELPIELIVEPLNDKISQIIFNIEFEIGTMKKFKKLPTKHTPLINFNLSTKSFLISGVSRPENADSFYQEVNQWIEANKSEIAKLSDSVLQVDLDYFNSVSLKNLLRVFRNLITINSDAIKVEWLFDKDDESAKEEAIELSEILKKEFVFIEK